jgi:hypothetical protein
MGIKAHLPAGLSRQAAIEANPPTTAQSARQSLTPAFVAATSRTWALEPIARGA